MLLKNKKILLAVTGSIAIYKALELIRLYIKAGAKVKVIMTQGAKKFINPLTFEAISENKVLFQENESWDKKEQYNHIDIGKWADIFIIAPCSANTINKLANGIADNLLLQTALAYPRIKLLAPAANTNMIRNPITQENLKKLEKYNFEIIPTEVKELICKDFGDGAMAKPMDIFHKTVRELLKQEYWINREVVLSGGGTIEKIDDVRYFSNFSSGKMANALARALYYKGAKVCLVATRGYEDIKKQVQIIQVTSSLEMYTELKSILESNLKEKKPYLFMVAAVSDFVPKSFQKGKIKKDEFGENWDLKLKKNIDILKSLEKKDIVSIGFKAEMDRNNALTNAKNMLNKKDLDAVCLNILDEKNKFGSENNNIELLLKDKSYKFSGCKLDISLDILNILKEEFKKYE